MDGEDTSEIAETICIFRKDDGQLIDIPFSQIIDKQGSDGFLQLEDGTWAKRCVQLELERDGKTRRAKQEDAKHSLNLTMVSDALGFGDHQLADFEADRRANNFQGIEFVRDPTYSRFIQVKCNCPATYERYVKHRNQIINNKVTGQLISQAELERAGEMVRERYDLAE